MEIFSTILSRLQAVEELAVATAKHLDSTDIPSRAKSDDPYDQWGCPDAGNALREFQHTQDFLRRSSLERCEKELQNYLDLMENHINSEDCGFTPTMVKQNNFDKLVKKIERLEKSLKKVRAENKELKRKVK